MSSILLNGDTSGTLTLTVPAVAGTNTITLPAATGTIITTASTSGVPNTISWQSVQTTGFTAVAGNGYPCNTTSAAFTVTLPLSPSAGNMVSIIDYAGTAATNNITINPNGNKINGNTVSAYISVNRESVNLVYIDSTQGWLAYSDAYSTTAPLPQPYTLTYLAIGGGSGGGANIGSGGGGGGGGDAVYNTYSTLPGVVYTVTLGSGGAAGAVGNATTLSATGLGTITAAGGTCITTYSSTVGTNGGNSGQIINGVSTSYTGGTTAGTNSALNVVGGGGAGSAANGGNGTAGGASGAGGNGYASTITGSNLNYGGGGSGGASGGGSCSIAPGGAGGGGAGQLGTGGTAVAGTVNTGGGGGGAGGQYNVAAGTSAAGGSGVVIISVPTANYTGITTGSPTVTTNGSNTVMKFTTSGSYTA